MVATGAETPRPERRFALLLANGAYTQKAPLSRPVDTMAELERKLTTMGFQVVCATDQDLAGMQAAALAWLRRVEAAADAMDMEDASDAEPLLLFFAYGGHGSAGRFFPVDASKKTLPEETFCFFDDFLFRLYEVLSSNCRLRHDWPHDSKRKQLGGHYPDKPGWEWRRWQTRIVAVIESCRRLSKEEQQAYEQQRSRIANGRRHLLPSVSSIRPDLATMGGAEWDAARLSFLSRLGPNSPQVVLALSSESTTPSYDVVFLRSIAEQIDRPVRLVGIFERASLDTLRLTGHKQKPVLLLLCDRDARGAAGALKNLVLAPLQSAAPLLRRSASATGDRVSEGCRSQLRRKESPARCLNSNLRRSLPKLA